MTGSKPLDGEPDAVLQSLNEDAPPSAKALLSLAQKAGAQGLYLQSTEWAEAALKVCPADDLSLRAELQVLLASHHWRLGHAQATMRAGTEAMALCEQLGDLPSQSSTLCAMCMACNRVGLHNQALVFASRALKIAQQLGDKRLECWALNRVGLTYDDMADHASGRRYLSQAAEIAQALGEHELIFAALNNLARSELMAAEQESKLVHAPVANEALQRAHALCQDNLALARRGTHPLREGLALGNLAEVQVLMGDNEAAIKTYIAYRDVVKPHGYRHVEQTIQFEVARLFGRCGQHEAAVQALLDLCNARDADTLGSLAKNAEQSLYENYKLMGDFENALLHLERFSELERTEMRERSDEQARVLQSQMQIDQAQLEAERARLDAELQRLRAAQLEEEQRSLLAHAASLGRAAREDPLTGLGNRRMVDETLPQLLNRARNDRTPLAMVMMDLDHFKRVNDDHGHAVGDTVLSTVARLLKVSTRSSDLLARIGGEEFIAVLVGTPLQLAADICERLRRTIEAHPWQDVSPGLVVTMSLGLIEVTAPFDAMQLMADADRTLYTAKHGGRNRVVIGSGR